MKRILLCAASLLVSNQAFAKPHLQGYYQAKELVGYTVNKIQQNKAEFFILDYALTLPAQLQAQFVSYNNALGHFQTENSGINETQFKRIVQKVNPSALQDQYVCRIDIAGVKLAYAADRGEECSRQYDSKPRAISQKENKVTFFRRWDIASNQSHFDIQSYDKGSSAETMTLDYLLKFNGRWVGSSVRVIKAEAVLDGGGTVPTYDVAQYQYFGPHTDFVTGGESLLYSDQPYFISDRVSDIASGTAKHIGNTVFNTVGLVDGGYRGRNVDTSNPVYWISRDYVRQYTLENGKKAYFVSDPQNFVIETSMTGPSDSWVWVDETEWNPDEGKDLSTSGDWVSHAFNNTHSLTGLSPTFCMIEDIANDRPVTAYYSKDGGNMWVPSFKDCKAIDPGYYPKVYTYFTNGYGEQVDVRSYKQSAKDILYVRNQYTQGGEDLMTLDDVKAMQSSLRYKDLKAELGKRLSWSKPYDILQ